MSLPYQAIEWDRFDAGAERLRGLRIGLLMDAGCGLPVDPEVRSAVEAAAQKMEQAGAIVEPMKPFMTPRHARRHGPLLAHALACRHEGPGPLTKRRGCCPTSSIWADSAAGDDGEPGVPCAAPVLAMHTRVATVAACARSTTSCRPPSPNLPAPANGPRPRTTRCKPLEHIAFTVPFNMSEQPAASVNCGYAANGLPIGLQIAGSQV
jgi:aspartyl-tRNA(Asn)/glutamyl-tRNA(Gln) amidotransferase subunit A